jgi:acyl-CoA thioesterase-2
MPICSLDDLLGCLAIEATGEAGYTAPNLELPYHRIFGGQLLAQAIAIATTDVAAPGDDRRGRGAEGGERGERAETAEKRVKSIHVTFPRPGDLHEPVRYQVTRVHDGKTFATRWLVGTQAEKPIFTALVSLHTIESGLDHQREAPSVGTPEDALPTDLGLIPWETRVVGGVDLRSEAEGPPRLEFWQRAPALPADPTIHEALFAYSTDLTLIGTSLRPHAGVSEAHSPDRLHTAVTSHSVWFHRPLRMDRWLLVAQESPSTAGARGFGTGHGYSQDGQLVASFAQESMLRKP